MIGPISPFRIPVDLHAFAAARGCRQTIPLLRSGLTASACTEEIVLGITPQCLRTPFNPNAGHHRANLFPEAAEMG